MYVITIPRRMEEARSEDAGKRWREAQSRERYGMRNCPDAFVDICWEFDPAEAHQALSAPPPWETYERIVEHLRKQPLPLDDTRSREVYKGVRRSLLKEALAERQYAAVLADAARFIESRRAGDGVSAAMLMSALTQTLLPVRLHLSSPDERERVGEVAALLVPAIERAWADLSDAAKEDRLRIDDHGAAYALARAESCLGSAYEFAAFVAQDPAEKERLRAKAFAVYSRLATQATEGRNAYRALSIGAFIAASRTAASDAERLELYRRMTTTMSASPFHGAYGAFFTFRVNYFLYDDVPPALPRQPSLFGKLAAYTSVGKASDGKMRPHQTWLAQTWMNQVILAVWEDCESAEARRAAVDSLIGLYATRKDAGDAYKGAIARLMLELHVRSGDMHWLLAGPGTLRAGGDSLPAAVWKKLAERSRLRRAELLAQLNDPNVCRDSDGLVIRRQDADLITEPAECAAAHAFVVQYPMASESRPSRLGAEYGNERALLEDMPSKLRARRAVRP
jgi:hypothetical protein